MIKRYLQIYLDHSRTFGLRKGTQAKKAIDIQLYKSLLSKISILIAHYTSVIKVSSFRFGSGR